MCLKQLKTAKQETRIMELQSADRGPYVAYRSCRSLIQQPAEHGIHHIISMYTDTNIEGPRSAGKILHSLATVPW